MQTSDMQIFNAFNLNRIFVDSLYKTITLGAFNCLGVHAQINLYNMGKLKDYCYVCKPTN